MTARLLSGKEVAAVVEAEVTARVAALAARGRTVGLATILVGDDPASQVYVRGKHRAVAPVLGLVSFDHTLPAVAPAGELAALIDRLNADPQVDGILLQMPLPGGLDPLAFIERIDPVKDADGLHPVNLGAAGPGPSRAAAGDAGGHPAPVRPLRRGDAVEFRGGGGAVLPGGAAAGDPPGLEGPRCHRGSGPHRACDRAALTRQADIVVVAAGRPGLIGPEHIRPGATVVDVGVNRTDRGLVGDVDFASVVEVAGAITPVPGGVGPLTYRRLAGEHGDGGGAARPGGEPGGPRVPPGVGAHRVGGPRLVDRPQPP